MYHSTTKKKRRRKKEEEVKNVANVPVNKALSSRQKLKEAKRKKAVYPSDIR